jgi:nitric oxide reductase large subunit
LYKFKNKIGETSTNHFELISFMVIHILIWAYKYSVWTLDQVSESYNVEEIVSLPECWFRYNHQPNKINNPKIESSSSLIFIQILLHHNNDHITITITIRHKPICCIIPHQQFWFLSKLSTTNRLVSIP